MQVSVLSWASQRDQLSSHEQSFTHTEQLAGQDSLLFHQSKHSISRKTKLCNIYYDAYF